MIDFQQKKYLFLLIYIFIFFSIFYFLVSPFLYKMKTLSKSLSYQKAILLTQNTQINKFNEFKANYNFFQKVLNLVDEGLIPKDTPIDFFNFLEEISKQYNLSSEIFQYNLLKKEKTNMISIKLGGDFKNIVKFLKAVENSKYFLEVSSVNIEKDKKDNTLSTFVNIKVFIK
ncbi:MAG: hypothetical protein ACP5H7_02345 [Minisyncoccia bacterium]